MSNVFNFKRFGKYFAFDLSTSWRNAGISTIIVSCMPVFIFAVYEFFALLLGKRLEAVPEGLIGFSYLLSMMIIVISFPNRQYGRITDKRVGSNWLLLPASRLEKWLSIVLICCVVLPIVWLAIICCSDFLLNLILPQYWQFGAPVIWNYFNQAFALLDNIFTLPVWFYLYTSWCTNVMFFLLGAVVFRKNKVVFSFLVLWLLGMIISFVMVTLVGMNINQNPDLLSDANFDPEAAVNGFSTVVYAISIIEALALYLGLYFRIKTIKH